jgi:hypothetical protein
MGAGCHGSLAERGGSEILTCCSADGEFLIKIPGLTGRFEIVYVVGDDPDAIPPPPDAVAGA